MLVRGPLNLELNEGVSRLSVCFGGGLNWEFDREEGARDRGNTDREGLKNGCDNILCKGVRCAGFYIDTQFK